MLKNKIALLERWLKSQEKTTDQKRLNDAKYFLENIFKKNKGQKIETTIVGSAIRKEVKKEPRREINFLEGLSVSNQNRSFILLFFCLFALFGCRSNSYA